MGGGLVLWTFPPISRRDPRGFWAALGHMNGGKDQDQTVTML